MKRTAKEAFGTDSLRGKKIAVQGVGNVAYALCDLLHKEGAELILTDINTQAVERAVRDFGAEAVLPNEIYTVDADIFAPCALGGILNDETIPQFKFKVICGSANNQLLDIEKHGEMLAMRGILYAPDYIVNAGGVINVADELLGYNEERAKKKIDEIYDQIGKVYEISAQAGIIPAIGADHMALKRIEMMKQVRSTFLMMK
ncbi:Leucine dehydrogenase [Listeria fleischmannii subsp. coloradonensis]|nr:Leucine dehydrogenase [Listeria fleischmannii subsp. coloradonensis]